LVLAPFGRTDSAYQQPLATARQASAASAHGPDGTPVVGNHHGYPELQAAGLWTTAIDLAKWVIGVQQVLRGERTRPISQAMAREMVTGVGVGPFGLGPEVAGAGRLRRFLHSGRNAGFCTHVDGLVELPTGAAVLTNGDGGTTLCGEVRLAVADEYGWGEIGAPPIEPAAVDPALLQSYVGRYVGPFDRPMKLELADGELYSPAPYGRRRMLALSDTTFLDEETGATLEIAVQDGPVDRIAVLVDGAELMAFVPKEDDR
ncbi:MAG: serine hydrolase, partial [Ilumatobacteraceae bacterium]|nr:serine hydrolase [Ilumatobacteraceae bacterium]